MATNKRQRNSRRAKSPARRGDSTETQPSARLNASNIFFLLLGLGILIRLVVFVHIGYLNNDNHLEVVEYVARTWLPAHADQFNQGYHPPLYYFLAAFFDLIGGAPAVHFFSLILSLATLALTALFLRQLPWVSARLCNWAVAFAALHPQFVLFGLFISNDSLAIFLGVLLCYQCRRTQSAPSIANHSLLGIYLGLGLLTKAVFLAFILPLCLLVWINGRERTAAQAQIVHRILIVATTATVLGSYKYVEQYILFGNPLLSNLDLADWVKDQQPTWIGLLSLLDVNLMKLIMHPVVSSHTIHSYPLMTYASFWYAYIPESTFVSNLILPLNRIGSAIYLLALVPTALIIAGITVGARAFIVSFLRGQMTDPSQPRERVTLEATLFFVVVLNLILILAIGWRYDAWSVFQGRLLFSAYLAILLGLIRGVEFLPPLRSWQLSCRLALGALLTLFLVYFTVEIFLARVYPPNLFATPHMSNTLDMRGP